jgi:hypothetical protein
LPIASSKLADTTFGRAHFIDMMTRNLRVVAGNYSAAGARPLILAGSIRDGDELARVRDAVGTPLRSVELTVPIADRARQHDPDRRLPVPTVRCRR